MGSTCWWREREREVRLFAKWDVCVNPCDAAILPYRALLLDNIRGSINRPLICKERAKNRGREIQTDRGRSTEVVMNSLMIWSFNRARKFSEKPAKS